MSCILRVSGSSLDVVGLAAALPLKPYRLDRKGERRGSRSRSANAASDLACAHYDVSVKDLAPLDLQVADAVRFLSQNRDTLLAMRHFPGVDACLLDFGVEWRDTFTHTDRLPPELLAIVGSLGFGIDISHYPVQNEEP